jgi:hypothetical protein
MYAYSKEERQVEKICYEQEHIDKVLDVIKDTFSEYFEDFLIYEGVPGPTEHDIQKISISLGVENETRKKGNDKAQSFRNILEHGKANFEKDRKKYLDIFDEEMLEEYQDDPSTFKSKTLRNECPIINATINNKQKKALDKYRHDYKLSNANELLSVVTNLYKFSENYIKNVYDPKSYDNIEKYTNLLFSELDTESCTVYGVIGGGIKSHMLYKKYPSVFPNRSRIAIWALWYLTGKKTIDCKMDSEFLMIDTKASITQQNYFYPYELFAFYAHQIFQLLKDEAEKQKIYIDLEYRYIIVDSFLSFVASNHTSEIDILTSQIKESDYGYT